MSLCAILKFTGKSAACRVRDTGLIIETALKYRGDAEVTEKGRMTIC